MSDNSPEQTSPQASPQPSALPPVGKSPAIRTLAMPADTNSNGDIFGGWLMSQMDIAGAMPCFLIAKGRGRDRCREVYDLH